MNKKFKKLLNNPKAYFKDYFSKQVRNSPNSLVSVISRALFSFSKEDFGFSKEIRSYLDTGDVELAEKKCLEALKVLPNSIKLYSMHAEVSMRQKDYDEAERRWKTVVEKFRNDPEGYEGQARLYTWRGEYDNAEGICKKGMDRFPRELWSYRVFAEISMFKKDYAEAIARWKTVRDKFPIEMAGYIRAVHACLELEDYAQAEELCNQALKAKNDILPYVELAEICMRQANFQEALTRWQTVRERYPKRAIGYIRASVAYSELDSFPQAERLCRQSMEVAPKDIRSFTEYAEISMRQRDFHEALKRWGVVRKNFPRMVLGYVRGSVAYCELENFPEAEKLCKKCMDAVPYDIRSFAEYAEISMRQKDFLTAVERWNTVRETFPMEPAGYIRGANTLCQIKDFSKAEELCRKCMEIVPYDISSFIEYAEISMRKSNYKDAANRWEIVCDKFTDRINGYLGWSRALLELHDYSKAQDVCTQVLKKVGNNPGELRSLYYCLIDIILKQRGRAKECISLMHDVEQTYTGTITDARYYSSLSKALLFILGRDREEINSPNTDFILMRLIDEPLYYSKSNIYLCGLLSNLSRAYSSIYEQFIEYLQNFIKNKQLNNPMAILISSASSNKDRINAHLKIIRDNCYHSVQLCKFQPQNIKMLDLACEEIIRGEEWKSFNTHRLFNFARMAIFADQDKGDNLVSKVYDLYKDKNLPVSDPVGLLCNRHIARQKLIQSVSMSPAPASASAGKRLNIAICVGGQLRGYKGNLSSLVKTLGLEAHNLSVFVHTWSNVGRKFPVARHAFRIFSGEFLKTYYESFINKSNLNEYIKIQYPNFYNLIIKSSLASYDDLKDEYKTTNIVIDNEDSEPFSTWENQEKMHYKIFAAHKLAIDSGKKFDLIIRLRPDLKRESEESINLVSIYEQSRSDASIFTYGGFVNAFWFNEYLIDDNFAIGIPETMSIYANTYLDFRHHANVNTYSRTKIFSGHTTLEHNLFCNGVHVDKIKQTVTGSFQDPERLSIKDIYAELSKDVQIRTATAEDRHLLDACKRDIASLDKD